jgi:hypothetical protein
MWRKTLLPFVTTVTEPFTSNKVGDSVCIINRRVAQLTRKLTGDSIH